MMDHGGQPKSLHIHMADGVAAYSGSMAAVMKR